MDDIYVPVEGGREQNAWEWFAQYSVTLRKRPDIVLSMPIDDAEQSVLKCLLLAQLKTGGFNTDEPFCSQDVIDSVRSGDFRTWYAGMKGIT